MIAENVLHFARILRGAGLTVGPDRVLNALAALEAVGVDRREDVHAALSAVMLDRHEQQPIFDAAFAAFWRDPKLLEQFMRLMLPKVKGMGDKTPPRANRLQEALAAPRRADAPPPDRAREDEVSFEATVTFSDSEKLQHADFESMTNDEFDAARRLARELAVPVEPVKRRRHEAASRGRLDLRATLLRMARAPQTLSPAFTRPREELPPIVVLLDISGSMDRYARLFLHYAHSLMQRLPHVHVLTFGTRLTDITRSLRSRDPDVALQAADAKVSDWKGGTRIASSLDAFNRRHARRMLGGNACVLLVTDGLDRDEGGSLGGAAAQLRRLAHRVVWLNPLLRFDGFQPKASGVRALLPHVDRMVPVHNLQSLADLRRVLRDTRL